MMNELYQIFTLLGIITFGWLVGFSAYWLIETLNPSKK